MELDSEPQTLTVEEAAKVLRIGRTTAYALAKESRATGGQRGIPVLELAVPFGFPERRWTACSTARLAGRNFCVTVVLMAKRPTGAERYFAEQKRDPRVPSSVRGRPAPHRARRQPRAGPG